MWEFNYSNVKDGLNGSATNVVPSMVPSDRSGVVNVVDDFAWTKTAGGPIARVNCPRIKLTERKVTVNGLYTQLAYQFGVFSNETARAPSVVTSGMQTIISAIGEKDSATFSLLGNATSALRESANKVTSTITNAVSELTKNDISNIINKNSSLNGQELTPYQNLYISEPTGFIYTLPYNVEYAFGTTSSFEEPSGSGVVGTLLTTAIKGMKSFTESTIAPGSFKYIENSKQFNFSGAATETFEIKFPLFNTGRYDDILKNWQFIYLLTYQNTPARVDKANVEPPCIYELEIPGMKYYPYAYIKDIRIDMLGTRKNYNLANVYKDKNGQPQSVTTVIPEAYMVTISVEALIQQTKNILYSPLAGSKSRINTSPDLIKPSMKNIPMQPVIPGSIMDQSGNILRG